MKNRLKALLCNVVCRGDDRREGGCGLRKDDRCDRIEKLDMCMIECITDHLLAEGVIVRPCKAGDKAYHLTGIDTLDELNVAEIFEGKVSSVSIEDKVWICCRYDNGLNFWYTESDIGKNLFFTREEAEKALAERSGQ